MKIGSKVATISSLKSKTQINNFCTSTTFTFYYTNPLKNNIFENKHSALQKSKPHPPKKQNKKTAKKSNGINFFTLVS